MDPNTLVLSVTAQAHKNIRVYPCMPGTLGARRTPCMGVSPSGCTGRAPSALDSAHAPVQEAWATTPDTYFFGVFWGFFFQGFLCIYFGRIFWSILFGCTSWFFFFIISVGCPGQFTRTTTIPHGPLNILQDQWAGKAPQGWQGCT